MSSTTEGQFLGGQWNHALLSHMLAPEIADFTEAQIPDLRSEFPELDVWIQNYFLNSVFGPNYGGKWRVYALNLIYRCQACIREFDRARTYTGKYLEKIQPGRPAVSLYFEALSSWENSLFHYKTAVDIFKKMNGGIGIFAIGGDTKEERAYYFANLIKHYEKDVGAIPDNLVTSGLYPENESEPHALPMWLANHGFSSTKKHLNFLDFAAVVRDMGQFCDKMRNTGKFIDELRRQRADEQFEGD